MSLGTNCDIKIHIISCNWFYGVWRNWVLCEYQENWDMTDLINEWFTYLLSKYFFFKSGFSTHLTDLINEWFID